MRGKAPTIFTAKKKDSRYAEDCQIARQSFEDCCRIYNISGTPKEKVKAYIKKYPYMKGYSDILLKHAIIKNL